MPDHGIPNLYEHDKIVRPYPDGDVIFDTAILDNPLQAFSVAKTGLGVLRHCYDKFYPSKNTIRMITQNSLEIWAPFGDLMLKRKRYVLDVWFNIFIMAYSTGTLNVIFGMERNVSATLAQRAAIRVSTTTTPLTWEYISAFAWGFTATGITQYIREDNINVYWNHVRLKADFDRLMITEGICNGLDVLNGERPILTAAVPPAGVASVIPLVMLNKNVPLDYWSEALNIGRLRFMKED